MHKNRFLSSTGLWAFAALATPAVAQQPAPVASAVPQAAAPAAEPEAVPSDIVVTGSARAQRRFDVSYAVNTLSSDDIKKLAPQSMAQLLSAIPGVQVESTGGEVQNITRVRGIPTDRGYLYFQQDGLPLFHDLDGYFFNAGDGMNRTDLMTQRVEVVRGGPAPIYASGAAAIANVITRTGTDTPHGEAKLTVGTSGLYRLDAYQSGPLGHDTYYAVGGFIRQNDGYRDAGFPFDRGGQIRGNLKHDFSNGSIKLSGEYVNDRNGFYLSLPTADPRNPSVSLNPFLNSLTGTLSTPALRSVNIAYRNGAGVVQNRSGDLADGRHMRMGNAQLDYEGDYGPWHVSAKAGYTSGRSTLDALYTTSNPQDATTFANGFRSAAQSAFGNVARLGYAIAGTNGATVYDPASQSGLVLSAQYRSTEAKFYSGQGDLSVTRKFETPIGTHDIRVGVYGADWGSTVFGVYQNYLVQVASQPKTLDLIAYDAQGAVRGYVTDNGALNDASSLVGGKYDAQMVAVYGTDTWDVTDKLRIDLGLRQEYYSYTGFSQTTAAYNLGNATTLADNSTRGFTGAIVNTKLKPKATNWTVGANYDLSRSFGVYARASQLEVPAYASSVAIAGSSFTASKAKLYEAGVKAVSGRSYLYVTGFYTKFDPLNASFTTFNPTTGRSDQIVNFVGSAQDKGMEADGQLRIRGPLSLSGALTVQDPKYINFTSSTGANAGAVAGKQIVRQPKVYGNIRPSLDFEAGGNRVSVYGRYDYVGKRFVDVTNTTALPGYGYFSAGVMVDRGPWSFQVAGDNITNAHGLTEGNTAGDTLTGQGTPDAIFGRPLWGRNVRFSLGLKW
ncbi:TonB-dependent receptor [Sphingomonas aurantiaca]|uniref:TonB-dependent receptor n=1 Tax=Sphingomonas aurantiaca TaxID=185949 RepID=UPI00334EAA43